MLGHITSRDHTLTYEHFVGQGPTLIFVNGHNSAMHGRPKCDYVAKFCQNRHIDFIRFDFEGLGLSTGAFEPWRMDIWAENLIDVIDKLTKGPVVLLGNSMGAYLMLLASLARPQNVCGLIGISSGVGGYIQTTGKTQIYVPKTDVNLNVALVNTPVPHHVISQSLPINCPVHLVHGLADDLVYWGSALNLCQQLTSPNVVLNLLKGATHGLNRPEDMVHVGQAIEAIYGGL